MLAFCCANQRADKAQTDPNEYLALLRTAFTPFCIRCIRASFIELQRLARFASSLFWRNVCDLHLAPMVGRSWAAAAADGLLLKLEHPIKTQTSTM